MRKSRVQKNPFAVSLIAVSLFCASTFTQACSSLSADNAAVSERASTQDKRRFGKPEVTGRIVSSAITESSGITASKCDDGVLWTHNDSGDSNLIFAIDQTGRVIGKWKVTGADNRDWEDIASVKDQTGRCHLFIGDIGNNGEPRSNFIIYKVEEPTVGRGDGDLSTARAQSLKFRYPDGSPDAETLLVHPNTEAVYVVTKQMMGAAGIFKIEGGFNSAKTLVAEKIGTVSVPAVPDGLITGGDISPDGRHAVLCDYFGAYEFTLPREASSFEDIWSQKPLKIELGPRTQGEAVAYSSDGKSLFATSEKERSPVIKVSIE